MMLKQKINIRVQQISAAFGMIALHFFCAQICWAGNITLTTYYPSPQGIYDRVSLIPQATTPVTCTIGTMMVDVNNKLLYCRDSGTGGLWGYLSNVWTQSGNNVYPTATDTDPLIFAGIGTSSSLFKLTLDNDGGILAMGTFGNGTTIANLNPARYGTDNARLIWYPRKAALHAVIDSTGKTNDAVIGDYSIAFGKDNLSSQTATTVSGLSNNAGGNYAAIAGGTNNTALATYATITGGSANTAGGNYSTVSGVSNTITAGDYSTIGGGQSNSSDSMGQTIGGGNANTINFNDQVPGTYATISGGHSNDIAETSYSVIGGGDQNIISNSNYSTIGGGQSNRANTNSSYSFIGGGSTNVARGAYSVVSGGSGNTAAGSWSVVTGGSANQANGNYATVLGGQLNVANGISSVIAGGWQNTVNGNYSVIAGGGRNTVDGDYSWAGGSFMTLSAAADRTFAWGFSDTAVNITAANAFILAPGTSAGAPTNPKLGIHETAPSGVLSITSNGMATSNFLAITSTSAATTGNIFMVKNNGYVGIGQASPTYPLHFGAQANNAYLSVGGVWTTPSSRKLKDNIQPLDTQKAVATLKELRPVTYHYKADKNEHHVGFIAEEVPDLIAAEGRKSVNPMNVTAILTAVLKEQKQNLTRQDAVLDNLEDELQSLKASLQEK